jgi:hypothetical protein
MGTPERPKIYHIAHVDKLASIIDDGYLWSDAQVNLRTSPGSMIGMRHIKDRRLNELMVKCHDHLYVGQCVPFYFCPRSVMLYTINTSQDPRLNYKGGQTPIVHLEADLHETVSWANKQNRRWAFTLSNAGSYYFEDRCNLSQLDEIDWNAVNANFWQGCREQKQAEFLIEYSFPWVLIQKIGVHSEGIYQHVIDLLKDKSHQPNVEIKTEWYY